MENEKGAGAGGGRWRGEVQLSISVIMSSFSWTPGRVRILPKWSGGQELPGSFSDFPHLVRRRNTRIAVTALLLRDLIVEAPFFAYEMGSGSYKFIELKHWNSPPLAAQFDSFSF